MTITLLLEEWWWYGEADSGEPTDPGEVVPGTIRMGIRIGL